ncbi:glycogen debranching N-terminal domain-containing protein [Robbsia sp. KACC 23696]|uniref:amylo-alpha-1,6-glucosidase n=1 Tax=Robbsia sp. KACC 23696 TaxID=3149231 RepID=UPI00325BB883
MTDSAFPSTSPTPPGSGPTGASTTGQGEAPAEKNGPSGTQLGTRFVLKSDDTFIVNDVFGDIGGNEDGLFVDDTRVLSRLHLTIAGELPSLLSGNVNHGNTVFTSHLTNVPLPGLGDDRVAKGVVHIKRMRVLTSGGVHEAIALSHFGTSPVAVPLSIAFDADFKDMFEVRGRARTQRGTQAVPKVEADAVALGYRGRDDVERTVRLTFSPAPRALTAGGADYLIELQPHRCVTLYLTVDVSMRPAGAAAAAPLKGTGADSTPVRAPAPVSVVPDAHDKPPSLGAPSSNRDKGRRAFRDALVEAHRTMRNRRHQSAAVRSSNTLFDAWLARSKADLDLLTSDLPTGPYPYAGIPWFSTAFGRDGILTALQMLWLQPSLARGVLRFLASRQAKETSSFQDAAPGKILHETRKNEMSATGEVPFANYYGGVDTTPLFIVLAGAYAARTDDQVLIDELWPALTLAAQWITRVCDESPLGLLAYQRGEASGLANQGWKDSQDSVFHADGRFPDGPIALVEVQGYACAALETMARFAATRAHPEHAGAGPDGGIGADYATRAAALRDKIETLFWMEEQRFYGIAVDGHGALCRVRASNAGHLLAFGLVREDRAQAVAAQLRGSAFDNGWGIRTLAWDQARYNPMSYHNGSVWPHDTALCAQGMAHYGDKRSAVTLLQTLHEAATGFHLRLPELFCGFPRMHGEPPTAYPVACLPQAWACGTPFMLLQACLGVEIDAAREEVIIRRPELPPGVEQLTIHDLSVGSKTVSLRFTRIDGRVVPSMLSNSEALAADRPREQPLDVPRVVTLL